ncbi:MAG: transglycosylase domain-containing protein [Deltaproteobacteria bacterium]|nr:transglycosylase domain-containing protein [Deltaproteobacteria bacterium]
MTGQPLRTPPTREAKTARRLLILLPSLAIIALTAMRLVANASHVRREAASYVAGVLATRTRAAVQLSDVRFDWWLAPCFRDVEIYRFQGPLKVRVAAESACVERWASAVGSGLRAVRIKLTHVSIDFQGTPKATANPLVSVTPEKVVPSIQDEQATLRELQIVFDDLKVEWDHMPFPERFSSGAFGPIDGTVAVQTRGRLSAATVNIREPTTGSKINGRITPTHDGFDLSAGLEGDLVPIFRGMLQATDLDIRRLPTRGRIGARYTSARKRLTVDVDLEQSNIDIANNIVARERLVGFDARQRARVGIDFETGTMEVKEALIEVNEIPIVLSLSVVATDRSSPTFELGIDLRTMPFGRVLHAIPGLDELFVTQHISKDILYALSFRVAGQLRDPETWAPRLDHSFQGIGPHGEGSGLEYLKGPFDYHPLTEEGRARAARVVGPGSPRWLGYRDIPYIQRRAVLVLEDATFFSHQGIEMSEIQSAIKEAMVSNRRARGGSTLTQQLVKNLFLTRERTAMRKIKELLLTQYIESVFTKEEIFTLYMNIIEWGPNVYGLDEAAHAYFGRRPQDLAPAEMVFLARAIPSPLRAYALLESGYVPSTTMARIHSTLARLNRLGQLSDAEYEAARSYRIHLERPAQEGASASPQTPGR